MTDPPAARSLRRSANAQSTVGVDSAVRALRRYGAPDLTIEEDTVLMARCGDVVNDLVDAERLVDELIVKLTKPRRTIVHAAWERVSPDGSRLKLEAVHSKFDSSGHPEVLAGRLSQARIVQEWADTFPMTEGAASHGRVCH